MPFHPNSNNFAIVKYVVKPIMSRVVVRKGPVATAGSMRRRAKMRGNSPPSMAAIPMDAQIDIPTTTPNNGICCHTYATVPRSMP
jgi:hypothetical protein